MGVGKSTVASALADHLDRPHRDSDRDLGTLFGRSGAVLAAERGLWALHRIEAALLLGALDVERPLVVSAAASVVDDEACRDALARRALVVVLDASPAVLAERMRSGRHRRPMTAEEVKVVAARRAPLFAAVADVVIDATPGRRRVIRTAIAAVDALPPGALLGSR